MARLFHAGAEIVVGGTAAQNTPTDGVNAGGALTTRDLAVFRSGVASWKHDSAAGNFSCGVNGPATTFTDAITYWMRVYFNTSATPGTGTSIISLGAAVDNLGGLQGRIRTDGKFELWANNTVQGSPTLAVVNDGVWHRAEVKGVATATGNWTAAELLLDGNSVATWSGSFARANTTSWGWTAAPGASKVLNTDDVSLNDSTGTTNNSWCGPGKVVLLLPISDNAVGTGWTLGTGTAIAGNTGSTAVKNTPPVGVADLAVGSDPKQIRNASSNANVNYDANMTTYTNAGVGKLDRVIAISPVIATAAPVATSSKQGTFGVASNPTITNIALGATGTAGAFWSGLAGGGYGAGWKWSFGTMTEYPTVTLGTSPVMRVTQVTSSTRIAVVCFMGMYIDYVPDAGQGIVGDQENLQHLRQIANKRSSFY